MSMIAACSSEEEPAPVAPGIAKPTGHLPLTMDELEAQMLEGIEDESVPMTEQDLDKYFPVIERLAAPEKGAADRDPTKGDSVEVDKAFNAFTTAETWDDHFTVELDGAIADPDVIRAKKGVLFGMERWDSFKAGFSLTAATKSSAGGKRFKVKITDKADPDLKYRAYVTACGGAPTAPTDIPGVVASVQADTCLPMLVLPLEPGKSMETLSPFIFVHEMAHVAQSYWTRSPAYVAAGGIKQAAAYSQELAWAFEADAQFASRHAPEDYAYDTILDRGCPFEPLRRGAYTWKNMVGAVGKTDEEKLFAYQMGIFVDQLTWWRFGKDPAWTYKWLTADPDPRSPGTPISATRKLLKLVSKDGTATDLKAINGAFVQAGVDLYYRGRNPWTARQLSNPCVRPSGTVALPLLSLDALRVDPGDLSTVAKLRLSLEASRDRDFLRAGVAALELDAAGTPEIMTCLRKISDGSFSNAEPRAECMKHLTPLAVLTPKNNFNDEVQLPITFQASNKYAIVAIVAHLMKRKDAPDSPINVTFRAEPISTPPGNQIAKSQCGALTEEYRKNCKTSDCFCIGNAYCEATVDPPPASCEKMQQECYVFCLFQKDECDCSSFCDLLYSRLACKAP
jgi:hypothetical protein